MESRKRKRDDEASPTIVTFHAPGDRRFDRLLRDPSLDDMKIAIRKKLKVSSDSTIRLAQLRDGVKIDLEDEDDFDALCVRASQQEVVDITIVVDAVDEGNPNVVAQHPSAPASSTPSRPLTRSQPVISPSSQTKKKSVNFDNMVTVRVARLGSSHDLGPQQRQEQPPPTPILKRGVDSVATSSDPVASSTPVQKKRKRAPLDADPEIPNAPLPVPDVSASTTESIRKKLRKRKKSNNAKATEDEFASIRHALEMSRRLPTVLSPEPDASSLSRTLLNIEKKGRQSKALEAHADERHSSSHEDVASKKSAKKATSTGTGVSEPQAGNFTSVAAASSSSHVASSLNPKKKEVSRTPKTNNDLFTSQLVKGIANSLNTSSLSPDPISAVVLRASDTSPRLPAASSSTSISKKKDKTVDSSFTRAEVEGAVKEAVDTVLKRGKHNTGPSEPSPPGIGSTLATSVIPITVSSSKLAHSTAPIAAELTSRDPSQSTPSVDVAVNSGTEHRPMPVVPGFAISEVAMESRGEGSSDESSSDSDTEEEEEPWEDTEKGTDIALDKLLAHAGASSLAEVDMDALLRGPLGSKTKGNVLAQIANISSNEDEEGEDNEKLSDHENSDEDDRSFRRLSKSLQNATQSSDEEPEGDENDDVNIDPPTFMDTDAPQSHQGSSAQSAISTPSPIEQAEVVEALNQNAMSLVTVNETVTPIGAAAAPSPKTLTSVPPPALSHVATPEEDNTPMIRSHPVPQAEQPDKGSQKPNLTAHVEDDREEVVPDSEPIDADPATHGRLGEETSTTPTGVSKRMKNRRGQVPVDDVQQPILASNITELSTEWSRPEGITGFTQQPEPIPPSSAEITSNTSDTPLSAGADAGENFKETAGQPSKTSSTIAPLPTEGEPKKARGRPKLSEEEKARRAAARQAETGDEKVPKPRARSKPTDEEKAKKAAEKLAEKKRKETEKRMAAEARATIKAAKEAAKQAVKEEKERRKRERGSAKQKIASKAGSKESESTSTSAPDAQDAPQTEQVAVPRSPVQTKKQQKPNPSSSKWTALSHETDDADVPEPEMTMIDELRSSSPDLVSNGSRVKKDALFFESQSQMNQLPLPSSPVRASSDVDDDSSSSADEAENGPAVRKETWSERSTLPGLDDLQSQDLFRSPLSPKPAKKQALAVRTSGRPAAFPRLSEFQSDKLFKSSPAISSSSKIRRSKQQLALVDEDEDEDESSDSESEADDSHIPKTRRAGMPKRQRSSLLQAWGK